ncbi:hypothetical protein [Pseudooceanicola sp.]|uniref:hypothetical protein n=1 Tax=Pseudooceanicola sp. TaxID=1914328 RepID=UPI0035174139
MTQRLVLHVGDCKTGSTILQTMLGNGDCRPERLRLFTPGNGVHGALARSLGDRKSLYPARWKGAARRLAEAEWDVAVLSSELFEFIAPQAVAEALRTHLPQYWDRTTVVAYIRPHMGRALSQFAENVKLGHEIGDFPDFVARFEQIGRLKYAKRLARWRDAFGDRLVVRPFLRDRLEQGDVRHDFLSLILHGDSYTLADSGQDDNASLPLADLALMRMIQQRFHANPDIPDDNRVTFGKQFGRLLRDLPSPRPADKLRLPRAVYDRLYDDCRADAERMDAEWFGGPCFLPELEAARDTVTDSDQSLAAEDHFDPETLRLVTAWAELIQRQMRDEPKQFGPRLRG